MSAIEDNVASRCGCDFREDRITNRVFRCFPSSPQFVTYHAQLHSTHNANASELISILQDWASAGATFPVQLLPLTVSSVCEVGAMPLEHCPGEALTTMPAHHTLTPAPSLATPPLITIIAGTGVVVFLIITIVIAMIIIVAMVVRSRRSNSKRDLNR